MAGGYDGSVRLNSVEKYDPIVNGWVSAEVLPENKYAAGSVVHDGKVFIVAGATASGVFSNKVFAADITPPMDLYYHEARMRVERSLDKLSTELADEFASSSAVSAPVGLVTAVDYNVDNEATTPSSNAPTAMPPTSGKKWPKLPMPNTHMAVLVSLIRSYFLQEGVRIITQLNVEIYDPMDTNQWNS